MTVTSPHDGLAAADGGSAGAPSETVGSQAGTAEVGAETVGAPPEAVGAGPGGEGAAPEMAGAPPAAVGWGPDSEGVEPETLGAALGGEGLAPEAGEAESDERWSRDWLVERRRQRAARITVAAVLAMAAGLTVLALVTARSPAAQPTQVVPTVSEGPVSGVGTAGLVPSPQPPPTTQSGAGAATP